MPPPEVRAYTPRSPRHRCRSAVFIESIYYLERVRSRGPNGSQYKVYFKRKIENYFNKGLEDPQHMSFTRKLVNVPVNKLFHKAHLLKQIKRG